MADYVNLVPEKILFFFYVLSNLWSRAVWELNSVIMTSLPEIGPS